MNIGSVGFDAGFWWKMTSLVGLPCGSRRLAFGLRKN